MTKKKIFMLTALVCSALVFQRLVAQDDEFLLDEDLLLVDTPAPATEVVASTNTELVVNDPGSGDSKSFDDLLGADIEEPATPVEEPAAPVEDSDTVVEDETVAETMDDADEDTEDLIKMNEFGDLDSDVTAVPEKNIEATLDGDDTDINTLIQLEINKKKAETAFGIRTFKEAEDAYKNERYSQSIRLYKEANKYLNNSSEARSYKSKIPDRLGETYYARALVLLEQGDYQIAENNAREAAQYGYSKAPELVKKCVEYQESPPVPIKKDSYVEWEKDSYKELQKDVSYFIVKGKEYMAVGNYDEAVLMFEGVLAIEPYNRDAIRLLEACGRNKYTINTKEVEATRANMMAEIREKWNPESYVALNTKPSEKITPGKTTSLVDTQKIRIAEKMQKIIIPELNFRQANIIDVIDFLQRASIEYDTTDSPPEEKGVNIILNLGADSAPAADVREPDPFAIPSSTASSSGSGTKAITFSSRYISLMEALKIVTQISQLKYRIDGSVVMIVPEGAPEGKIIVKTYDVLPSVEDKIPSVSSEMSMGGGGVGGGFGLGGDTGLGDSAAASWKDFFGQMGVRWPDGSQIKYIRQIGKIVVANTEDNLIDFERILKELNVVPNQIEIEARFVEVNENDMNSLGFEWFLNDNYTVASKKGNYAPGAAPRVDIMGNKTTGGFTTGNRFIPDVVGTDAAAVSDSVLSIAGILTNPELGLVIHALEQKGHADLLSSPKVTTQTGQEATIKVVTEYIYPTAYEVTPVTGETDQNTSVIIGGIVEPQDFQMREVGVILTVQPDVSPEGQMITLNMTPEVVTEPDWKNYGTTYTDQEGNVQQLMMEQPFFHTRLVQTSIAIYNGATVVMGGMITEKREDTVDKIPFLGDIPLIGTFFTSKTSQSQKRNLLIFVTARLVDPAGRPVEDSSIDLIADKLQQEADESNE